MLLKKVNIQHMISSVATITKCRDIVMVGSGALIATSKTLPAELMMTGEVDVYVRDTDDPADIQDLIEGTLGEGSQFQKTFRYFVDAVDEKTAILPLDWQERAIRLTTKTDPPTTLTCPSPNDLAISKCIAWRDKDRDWLKACARHRLIDPDMMLVLAERVRLDDFDGLDTKQLLARIELVRAPGSKAGTAPPKRPKAGIAPPKRRRR